VASIEIRPELYNSWQYAHGGVVMTLLDVTMGSAARSSVPHAAGVVTVDMSVSFIAAGQGRLTVEGRVLRKRRLDHFLRRRDARRGRRAGGEGDGLLQGETKSQSRRHGGLTVVPAEAGTHGFPLPRE
jgi:acyl-coenzyme A thioesterase PaaI-like protein